MKVSLTLFATTLLSVTVMAAPSSCVSVYKRADEARTDRIRNLGQSIDKFVSDLRPFVNDSGLDYERFRVQMPEMKLDLSKMKSAVLLLAPREQSLEDRLLFVVDKFRAMRALCEYEKYYKNINAPGDDIISALNDLEMRLLLVQDSHGKPDRLATGYTDKLARFNEEFQQIKSRFHSEEVARKEKGPHSAPELAATSIWAIGLMLDNVGEALESLNSVSAQADAST
ncbi:hypothetical protein OXX69_005635 [Metschnikowia pulcherrima]